MEHKKIKAIAFDLDHTLYDRYGTLRSIAYLLKQRYKKYRAMGLFEEK